MKPFVVVSIAVVLSAAASFLVARVQVRCADAAPAAAPEELGRLADAVAGLSERQAALAKSVEELRAKVDAGSLAESRVPVGEIEAAVARALGTPAPAAASEPPAAEAKPKTARAFLDELLAGDLSDAQVEAIWKEAAAAGRLDELVALFEERALADPGSADAQVQLGRAYLQKLFTVGSGPEAGTWAIKADKSFDAALAVDDHHWEARFSKAISLSFWPPVFGKQTEAIKHFEILIEQQSKLPAQPGYAETWLLLGNMYQQLGKSDEALATWRGGLALFPDNSQLAQQIANGQGN